MLKRLFPLCVVVALAVPSISAEALAQQIRIGAAPAASTVLPGMAMQGPEGVSSVGSLSMDLAAPPALESPAAFPEAIPGPEAAQTASNLSMILAAPSILAAPEMISLRADKEMGQAPAMGNSVFEQAEPISAAASPIESQPEGTSGMSERKRPSDAKQQRRQKPGRSSLLEKLRKHVDENEYLRLDDLPIEKLKELWELVRESNPNAMAHAVQFVFDPDQGYPYGIVFRASGKTKKVYADNIGYPNTPEMRKAARQLIDWLQPSADLANLRLRDLPRNLSREIARKKKKA